MKAFVLRLNFILMATSAWAGAQTVSFTNFVRQIQLPSGVQWDMSVAPVSPDGGSLSPLEINPGGARFELWTVRSSPLTSYLLDTRYVGTYVPVCNMTVRSEDPYTTIPRTRADRPFYVDYKVSGLLNGATDPVASKSVKLLRHVQSYGVGGTGINIDRTQAALYTQASISANGNRTLTYTLTSVPGANRTKVRGEERFSIFSLEDYQAPESQLASQFIQIWPVADGSISGIAQNEVLRFAAPPVTISINDLYPSSNTYVQVYKGDPVLGKSGAVVVPGSSLALNESVPQSRVLTLSNYDSAFDSDGRWTMELITETPFGIDRLAFLSFDIDRTIAVNATVTSME